MSIHIPQSKFTNALLAALAVAASPFGLVLRKTGKGYEFREVGK